VTFIFRHHLFRFPLLLLSLFSSITLIQAQGGVGSSRGLPSGSGRHTIKGRIIGPDGKPYQSGLRVRLEGDIVGSNSTSTDTDGAFIFNNLTAGNYAIVIEAGSDHDALREPVTIYGSGGTGPQTVIVPINLRARGAAAAFAKVPKSARESYTKGMEAAGKGENQMAAELLDKAVTIYPEFQEALTELGLLYMKLGQMDKAEKTYEALLKLKPAEASAHLNLGIALYNQSTTLYNEKRLEEARVKLANSETHLRESLKLNSTSAIAHYYVGLIMIRSRKYPEAQKEMELSIASGGENLALAHKYLGGLYMSAKRNKDAADELEKYLQLDPKAKDADQIRGTIKDLRAKQ
jgi:Tfp pilus assembly protein PilF